MPDFNNLSELIRPILLERVNMIIFRKFISIFTVLLSRKIDLYEVVLTSIVPFKKGRKKYIFRNTIYIRKRLEYNVKHHNVI